MNPLLSLVVVLSLGTGALAVTTTVSSTASANTATNTNINGTNNNNYYYNNYVYYNPKTPYDWGATFLQSYQDSGLPLMKHVDYCMVDPPFFGSNSFTISAQFHGSVWKGSYQWYHPKSKGHSNIISFYDSTWTNPRAAYSVAVTRPDATYLPDQIYIMSGANYTVHHWNITGAAIDLRWHAVVITKNNQDYACYLDGVLLPPMPTFSALSDVTVSSGLTTTNYISPSLGTRFQTIGPFYGLLGAVTMTQNFVLGANDAINFMTYYLYNNLNPTSSPMHVDGYNTNSFSGGFSRGDLSPPEYFVSIQVPIYVPNDTASIIVSSKLPFELHFFPSGICDTFDDRLPAIPTKRWAQALPQGNTALMLSVNASIVRSARDAERSLYQNYTTYEQWASSRSFGFDNHYQMAACVEARFYYTDFQTSPNTTAPNFDINAEGFNNIMAYYGYTQAYVKGESNLLQVAQNSALQPKKNWNPFDMAEEVTRAFSSYGICLASQVTNSYMNYNSYWIDITTASKNGRCF